MTIHSFYIDRCLTGLGKDDWILQGIYQCWLAIYYCEITSLLWSYMFPCKRVHQRGKYVPPIREDKLSNSTVLKIINHFCLQFSKIICLPSWLTTHRLLLSINFTSFESLILFESALPSCWFPNMWAKKFLAHVHCIFVYEPCIYLF